MATADDDIEVVHAVLLPAWSELAGPFGVCGSVESDVDGGGSALEDVEVLCSSGEMGDCLDSGCSCADDADAFIGYLVQPSSGIAPGIWNFGVSVFLEVTARK